MDCFNNTKGLNCPPSFESIEKSFIQSEITTEMVIDVMSSLIGCLRWDVYCMRDKVLSLPKEHFPLAMQLSQVIIGCGTCETKSDVLKVPYHQKYSLIPDILSPSESCDVAVITNGTYTEDPYDTYDPYELDNEVVEQEEYDEVESMMKNIETSEKMKRFSKLLFNVNSFLSASEEEEFRMKKECQERRRNMEGEDCYSYQKKVEIEAFAVLLKNLTGCNDKMCKDGINQNNGCYNNTAMNSPTKALSILHSAIFTGCDVHDPFMRAVMQCSLFSIMYKNGKEKKVFGHSEALDGFKKLKRTHPKVFTALESHKEVVYDL